MSASMLKNVNKPINKMKIIIINLIFYFEAKTITYDLSRSSEPSTSSHEVDNSCTWALFPIQRRYSQRSFASDQPVLVH